ncbi:MAG: hypothetical protein AAB336_09895 [Acidobacteriota bacterium]
MTSENTIKVQHLNKHTLSLKNSGWQIGAMLGLFGGLGAIFVGAILTFVVYLTQDHALQTTINFLFYLVFPLFFFGAYCLDKADEIIKKNK